jgi:hypothetical protein
MSDRYSKIVLTVIAAALLSIAVEHAARKATAAGEQACGTTPNNPCYIRIVNSCWGTGPCLLQ